MSYICENCGKRTVYGINQKHKRGVAGKRWRKRATRTLRTFKPNLQWITLSIKGEKRRMRLCTKCIKKYRNDNTFLTIWQNA